MKIVEILHFDGHALGSFKRDVITAVKAAKQADDTEAINKIWNLWLDYLSVTLPAKGKKLPAFLSRLQSWRTENDWVVFLAGEGPSVAFASQTDEAGKTTLVLLGACYRFSPDSDRWWIDVIQTRLRSI